MKKSINILLIALLAICVGAGISQAEEKIYQVSAEIPQGTGVSITSLRLTPNGPPSEWEAPDWGQNLSFGTLTLDNLGVFRPSHYFVIQAAADIGGAVDVILDYNEGNNPNGTGNGLGYKSSAVIQKAYNDVNGDPQEDNIDNKALINLVDENYDESNFEGGWFRAYIGLATGETFPDPSLEIFSAADNAGVYSGTLTVTATVD